MPGLARPPACPGARPRLFGNGQRRFLQRLASDGPGHKQPHRPGLPAGRGLHCARRRPQLLGKFAVDPITGHHRGRAKRRGGRPRPDHRLLRRGHHRSGGHHPDHRVGPGFSVPSNRPLLRGPGFGPDRRDCLGPGQLRPALRAQRHRLQQCALGTGCGFDAGLEWSGL